MAAKRFFVAHLADAGSVVIIATEIPDITAAVPVEVVVNHEARSGDITLCR